jgi:DNA-binding transcriptional MerR regulator
MTQWYVKELSKLTDVSVQTLHHYDRIGLLTPSVRLANGYRLYSEKDLLKLQQIIALKFFGFELSQIKKLLNTEVDVIDHFADQSSFLEEKAKILFEASQTLKNIVSECSHDKSIPWETIIQLIEVYRMTQQLEKTWAGKVFTPDELKIYAHFEKEIKNRFTEREINSFRSEWETVTKLVNANLDKDPSSDFGIALGKRCMDCVNDFYGRKYVSLRNSIWEKGFKNGLVDHENPLSQESFAWLDKAISSYYRSRILKILNQVEMLPNDSLMQQWEELLIDMHGDELEPRNHIFELLLKDERVSEVAKNWLRKFIRK